LPAEPEEIHWHPNDVAALEAAASVTIELARRRGRRPVPLVMAFRVKIDAERC
jgi:hypothetical protein